MTKKVCYSLLTLIIGYVTALNAQQITVDNSFSAQQLIENNLVQGCVETSNISSPINGSVNGFSSFGYFERGDSNFPFENGIVLTTGNAFSAGNTTNANVLNEGETNWGTDTDLENALGITSTLNATTIEFDFVSISNQIQFNYILASEEYFGNFPCEYSDGFAFLIRPVGSTDPYTNIAVIPGTNTPVNTSTIHDEIVGFCAAENETFFDGYNIGDTNYNGRTQTLTATASIVPNVAYSIKLVIADQTDENYDSAVFIEGNSFNATVDLGNDITTCADSVQLNGDIQNPDAVYAWYQNGVLLDSETSEILNVNTSATYTLEITIPLSGSTCVIEDAIEVTLSSEQTAADITDYEVCDDVSGDGIASFNLSTKTNEVLSTVPSSNYNISYHYSLDDAENNTGAITNTIQNTTNPQTIFVRIEDTNSGCLAYSSFNLVVNPLPEVIAPSPIVVCDDANNDGFTQIDLSQTTDEVANGNTDLIVSYHNTQADANTGNNPVILPYINNAPTEDLYIRVVDGNTGCSSTTLVSITVNLNPELSSLSEIINACDPDLDGFDAFDLTEAIDAIIQGLTNVTITYHTTQADAQTGDNPIDDPTDFTNTSEDTQTVFVRVVDNTTGCFSIANIFLHTNLLLTGSGIGQFDLCDDESNDGIEAFDLTQIEIDIINDLPNVNVTFYETEEDRDNQTNPIDESAPYLNTSNPQTLYIELIDDSCGEVSEIVLNVNPHLQLPNVHPIDYCDTDDDGFTTIDLTEFDDLVTDGNTTYTVNYYESQADAENQNNTLPLFYNNISNPEQIFALVTNPDTGCTDIVDFTITIIPAPTVSQPTDIIICDDDQDGFFIVDLTSKISEIVTDTNTLNISFHLSRIDAENNDNTITNPDNFNAETQIIYTRVESTITTCHSIVNIPIIINTLPIIPTISNYQICEIDGDEIEEFTFNTKDTEIINGQAGKRVLYYENQADADARINEINKNVPYQNTSNPQTIFVRVENVTDTNCYNTSSFTITVDPLPSFNAPLDWFICDDASNDGVHTFNLTEKITEISNGIAETLNITFYTSFANADAGENEIDLEFTNTQNPQQIYARVENGSNCHTIAEFGLNVIQSPETNPSVPIEVCDNDYDGISIFDLTISEFDVLNIRQDNIVVTYYENENDVNNQVNEISNPENYNNTSNPQTVYIRITNTISNCYIVRPLDLIVNLPPELNDVDEIPFCETEDGTIALQDITSQLIDDQTNIAVSYYESQTDAENNQNQVIDSFTYSNTDTTLFVRATYNDTGCFIIDSFNLHIDNNPIAFVPNNLGVCDDDDDEIADFDLSLQTATIIGGQNATNLVLTYHETAEDADNDENAIDTNYLGFNEQIIYVRLENNLTGCYDTTEFMLNVHPLPVIDLEDLLVICLDELPLTVSANTGFENDLYNWSTGESTPEINIDTPGIYSVTVTTEFGCQTSKEFEVIQSEPATIEVTEVVDFSDPNNITITVSGIGNYAYILDDGEPQTSNVFEYVSLGYHTITVIDLNGCSEVVKEVVVVDVPKFFTPNDDGYFDTWHITGVETLPGTVVMIYDRYGKQLHKLNSSSIGWDGLYNGKPMPTNDYWFVADVKKGTIEFQIKGHFTLKR